ncbi:KRAB-A domain-containing protein 2-like [Penaeus indicus]|uniref:KRAB-A domain-containing protein 2-like n=1 Tax=Penaeus indicus TaxID=29960 RepID=UPI00300D9EA7
MARMPEVSQPFERVSADLLDLQGSNSGNRYVLSINDHLTRYLQLIPLLSKDAETVTTAFIQHYVTLFGPPRILQTDNGSEFTNLLFSQACQLLKTKTSFTTAYHPQANGMVERSNRVVKDALATLALNTAVHRSIGEQPLYLLTGQHAQITMKMGPVVYECQETSFPYRKKTFHVNQMKPYLAREELEFADADGEDGEEDYECGDWDEPGDPGTAALLSFVQV